jgi:hypothetical protein
MNRIRSFLPRILVIFVFISMEANAKSHEEMVQLKFMGTAYALNQDSQPEHILYTEHHSILQNALGEYLESKVEYRSAEGNIIAIKALNFSEQQTLPEISFDDLRTKNSFETKNRIDQHTASVLLSQQEGSSLQTTTVGIDRVGRAVVDAGFDLFVLKHWDALIAGNKVKLDFLALSRASFFGFHLEKKTFKDGQLIISLKPSSFLLSLLVDPILLTYDADSKRLISFEGLTNIEQVVDGKAEGRNHVARIEYTYSE